MIRITNNASTVSLRYRRFIMKAFVFGQFCDSLQSILDEYRLLLRSAGCVYHARMSLRCGRIYVRRRGTNVSVDRRPRTDRRDRMASLQKMSDRQ